MDRSRTAVDSMLLVPPQEQWAQRETAVERATSTTRIEGIGEQPPRTVDEARAVRLANDNAGRAYEFVDYLSANPEVPLDELVVRQLNREFLRGGPEILTPGAYRRGQNAVGGFTPPDQGDVPELMRDLVGWLRGAEEPVPISSAIAHLHLVAIHPFWDGNGRTARALALLLLQRSPWHFRRLMAIERRLLDERSAYFAALERTVGARFDAAYDATPWLEFYLPLLAAEASSLVERLTSWTRRMAAVAEVGERHRVPQRAREALAVLGDGRTFTRADYIAATGVPTATASRDLRRLVEAGLVGAHGNARTRTYRAASQLPRA